MNLRSWSHLSETSRKKCPWWIFLTTSPNATTNQSIIVTPLNSGKRFTTWSWLTPQRDGDQIKFFLMLWNVLTKLKLLCLTLLLPWMIFTSSWLFLTMILYSLKLPKESLSTNNILLLRVRMGNKKMDSWIISLNWPTGSWLCQNLIKRRINWQSTRNPWLTGLLLMHLAKNCWLIWRIMG